MKTSINGMSPQLLVTGLQRSIDFYTQHLGFEVAFLYEDFYAGIVRGACSIHLKTGQPDPGERAWRRKNEDLDISFSVEGIRELYNQHHPQGLEIIQPLRVMPYGSEFYISDPDGYILAFVEGNADGF